MGTPRPKKKVLVKKKKKEPKRKPAAHGTVLQQVFLDASGRFQCDQKTIERLDQKIKDVKGIIEQLRVEPWNKGELQVHEERLRLLEEHRENLISGKYKQQLKDTIQVCRSRILHKYKGKRRAGPALTPGLFRSLCDAIDDEYKKAFNEQREEEESDDGSVDLDVWANWNVVPVASSTSCEEDANAKTPLKPNQPTAFQKLKKDAALEFENVLGRHVQIPLAAKDVEICARCNIPLEINAEGAQLFCPSCGESRQKIDATVHSVAYGDDVEIGSFNYKKTQHALECLAHRQAKCSEIPIKSIEEIFEWLWEKGNVRRYDEITTDLVAQALRSFGERGKKLLDRIPQIFSRLTGYDAPRITNEHEEWGLLMFSAIQRPWQKHKRLSSRNMISYPYCLFRFSALRGFWGFLPQFKLLQEANIEKHEPVFRAIYKDLHWEFRPLREICLSLGITLPAAKTPTKKVAK